MAKAPPKKKPPPKRSDPNQSKRFVDAARALETAGELNLTDAGERFERAFGRIVKPKATERRG